MNTAPHIVIVTYNGMPWIQRCLESCGSSPVVVVDNNSTDTTVAFIQKNFPNVQVLPQNTNLGFGQGNNLGIRHAMKQGAAYVFLLNQDAYVQEGCLETLVGVQQNNPEYGVVSPVHFNGDGSTLDSNFMLFLNRYKVSATMLSDGFKAVMHKVYPIEFVNAAAWLISRKCLETVGGFDPLFFHYGEDRNYCQRVQFHHFKTGIATHAGVLHDRANREKVPLQKYSNAYYSEFERYLKIDWADINRTDFEAAYDTRSQYLASKRKRFLLKFQFKKAADCARKHAIMRRLKSEITNSRRITVTANASYL